MLRTAVAGFLVSLLVFGGCAAGEIAVFPEKKEMKAEEIVADLTGDDFRKKNAAREQLDKLSVEQRISVLEKLLADKGTPTRLLAVSELGKLKEHAAAKALLEKTAASDPSATVKSVAAMALGQGASLEEDTEDSEGGEGDYEIEDPDAEQ